MTEEFFSHKILLSIILTKLYHKIFKIARERNQKMIYEIRKELQNLIDTEYAKFNQKLCPDTKKKMLGIRVPRAPKIGTEDCQRTRLARILETGRR